MRPLCCALLTLVFSSFLSIGFAGKLPRCDDPFIPSCDRKQCCHEMGGISYCDSSAGRYVCSNGYYSSCYCTRHAVMDMQKFQGCCLWQGGVLDVTPLGVVVCNDGSASPTCSRQSTQEYSHW